LSLYCTWTYVLRSLATDVPTWRETLVIECA
jgi:hypothetical protein